MGYHCHSTLIYKLWNLSCYCSLRWKTIKVCFPSHEVQCEPSSLLHLLAMTSAPSPGRPQQRKRKTREVLWFLTMYSHFYLVNEPGKVLTSLQDRLGSTEKHMDIRQALTAPGLGKFLHITCNLLPHNNITIDRGAWLAAVHRRCKESDLTLSFSTILPQI